MSKESLVYQLAKQRDPKTKKWLMGRKAIRAKVPELSEWAVRNIIKDVRGEGTSALKAKTPEEKITAAREAEQLSMPQIVVNIPSFSPKKAPSSSVKHWVIGSDFHVPYQHDESCEIFYQVISDLKPEKVILLGDVLNLDEFSSYEGEGKYKGSPTWIDEIEATGKILGNIFAAANTNTTKVEWYEGNHELRLKKHLMRNDPILYAHLDVPKLFKISGNTEAEKLMANLSYIDKCEVFDKSLGMIIKHGEKVRKHAGMSVQSEVDDLLLSVVMGHCHRLGLYRRSSGLSRYYNEQPLFGMETGCLSNYDLPYVSGATTNWQHGFGVLTIDTSGNTLIEPSIIEINQGRALFRGKIYRS